MPKQLIATAPRTAEILDYQLTDLGADQVRIKVDYASPKHGTELTDFRGDSPWEKEIFDAQQRMFMPKPSSSQGIAFGSWNLGNMFVGHIVEVGTNVQDYEIGDRVCTYGGIKEYHTIKAVDNFRLRKMTKNQYWKNALCYDPAQYALGGVRDANVLPGDTVAVFGLGAIGMIAVQLCKNIGCRVFGVDPIEKRRNIALNLGAEACFDPTIIDVGAQFKKLTGGLGVDSVIETSGSSHALQSALRGLGYGGIISYVAFAKEFTGGLNFGKEAHFNNASIVFSRAANEPNKFSPRWDRKRIEETVWSMLMDNTINCESIIDPVYPFSESADAYMTYVDHHPEKSIKLGITFKEE